MWVHCAPLDSPCDFGGLTGPGTIDRDQLTGSKSGLLCKAVAELAADACVGRREVVDVAVGSREPVEPSLADIDENRRMAW